MSLWLHLFFCTWVKWQGVACVATEPCRVLWLCSQFVHMRLCDEVTIFCKFLQIKTSNSAWTSEAIWLFPHLLEYYLGRKSSIPTMSWCAKCCSSLYYPKLAGSLAIRRCAHGISYSGNVRCMMYSTVSLELLISLPLNGK